ncbi:MAG TPA: tRNA (adenosine(37)-N6)-threonylcarbamoyltransferase complex dimerization subunit type 1 TsaB, partial [Patescibacteria group bacterium]|nr:tRNA (adenosine(37)-N6)-threonylcarbamoyltransferase complex dimerization subunit type 1 TsaB [Patescibacteria group bacterium]
MPDKKQTRDLIKGVGVPILGPSANFSNGKTPFKIEEIDKKLISLVDYVLPGDTKRVKTSTVIDCSKNSWEVLRKGEIEIIKNIQKNIVLVIDTATMDIKASLIVNGKSYSLRKKAQKAQILLPLIEEILRKHNLFLQDISRIKVNTGPGSFTGLRVGISIANALGVFLGIPINNKKIGELEEPKYK